MLRLNLYGIVTLMLVGCVVPEPRRTVIPERDHTALTPYLAQVQQGAMAISIIDNVLSIPGVFDGAPADIARPLKRTVTAMRYFGKPTVSETDSKATLSARTIADTDANGSQTLPTQSISSFDAWFDQSRMYKFAFNTEMEEARTQHVILEEESGSSRRVRILEIFGLFSDLTGANPDSPAFVSGFATYNAETPGTIDVQAKDLDFVLKKQKFRISFTITVDESSGAIINGTIAGKILDQDTNGVTGEYTWDLEKILEKAKSWQAAQANAGATP